MLMITKYMQDIFVMLRTVYTDYSGDTEPLVVRRFPVENSFEQTWEAVLEHALSIVAGHHECRDNKSAFKQVRAEAKKALEETGRFEFTGDYLDEMNDDSLTDELEIAILGVLSQSKEK